MFSSKTQLWQPKQAVLDFFSGFESFFYFLIVLDI